MSEAIVEIEGMVTECRVEPEFRFGEGPTAGIHAEFLVLTREGQVVTVPCRPDQLPIGGGRVRVTVTPSV